MEYDPSSYALQEDPFPVYQWMRDEAPLYRNERLDFWALTRFDDVAYALTDHETYSSASGIQLESGGKALVLQTEMMLMTDPPKHERLRRLVSRAFTPKRIAGVESGARARCGELLDGMAASGGGDLASDYAARLPMSVIAALVGLPDDQTEVARVLADRVNHREPGSVTPSADSDAAAAELYHLFARLIAERRESPADDLASALISSEVTNDDGTSEQLNDFQITAFAMLLAVAGYETTSKVIANAAVALERFADQRQLVLADRSLVPALVEEALRFDAPTQYLMRVATRPVTWYGSELPAGSRIVLVLAAANRDERAFADPDRFDLQRPKDRHVGFGQGSHFCIGAALARLECRVALEELLARFPAYRIDLGGLERRHSSSFRGLSRVPVAFR